MPMLETSLRSSMNKLNAKELDRLSNALLSKTFFTSFFKLGGFYDQLNQDVISKEYQHEAPDPKKIETSLTKIQTEQKANEVELKNQKDAMDPNMSSKIQKDREADIQHLQERKQENEKKLEQLTKSHEAAQAAQLKTAEEAAANALKGSQEEWQNTVEHGEDPHRKKEKH